MREILCLGDPVDPRSAGGNIISRIQVAAMLDRVLSETSKIPELESVIAEVIEVTLRGS